MVCTLYFSGYPYVHDIEKRIATSLKPHGYLIGEGPTANPKDLGDGGDVWQALGVTVLRLEYRADKADWGQPGFGRFLIQKGTP